MAIKSIKDLPGKNRPGKRQAETAIKAKPIERKGRVVERKRGKLYYDVGTVQTEEAAGVVKGFRRKFKADFGVLVKDTDGNVIARTHVAKGSSTIPEQLVVKVLSKYGKAMDEVQLVMILPDKQKGAVKKSEKNGKSGKKITKKSSKKKISKKPTKKIAKKPTKKSKKK
jgi:hypothetical protein